MPKITPNEWNQIKALTSIELIRALKKDGWAEHERKGAARIFSKGKKTASIHYHPSKAGYGAKLLKHIIFVQIGWTIDDLKRLKLIK